MTSAVFIILLGRPVGLSFVDEMFPNQGRLFPVGTLGGEWATNFSPCFPEQGVTHSNLSRRFYSRLQAFPFEVRVATFRVPDSTRMDVTRKTGSGRTCVFSE